MINFSVYNANISRTYVTIANYNKDIIHLEHKDDIVINKPSIQILYNYPFKNYGSTYLEQLLNGWIFTEHSPNNQYFTKANLLEIISIRYYDIFNDPNKYNIWGHTIYDLTLNYVKYDPEHDLYTLDVDN
jgi:hypothetical protein